MASAEAAICYLLRPNHVRLLFTESHFLEDVFDSGFEAFRRSRPEVPLAG